VVLTWDEDDHSADNNILTVFAGPLVRPGTASARRITHYTLLRTLCDGLGIAPFGEAASEAPITDVWFRPAPSPVPTKP
jgi:acid phosphatase